MKQIKGAIKFTTLPLFVDVKCLYSPRHTLTHFYVRIRYLIITLKLSNLSYRSTITNVIMNSIKYRGIYENDMLQISSLNCTHCVNDIGI